MLEDLTRYITKDEDSPAAGGGFGQIWKCTYRRDRGITKVCLQHWFYYMFKVHDWTGCGEITDGIHHWFIYWKGKKGYGEELGDECSQILLTQAVVTLQRIQRELMICARLQHRHILPIYGYTYGFGPLKAIVSPWAGKGNLTAYLKHLGAALCLVRRFQIVSLLYISRQRQTDRNVSSEISRMAWNIVCISFQCPIQSHNSLLQFMPTMLFTATWVG